MWGGGGGQAASPASGWPKIKKIALNGNFENVDET